MLFVLYCDVVIRDLKGAGLNFLFIARLRV